MATNNIKRQTVPAVTVVKKMRNYDNDPFFIKKKQQAIDLLVKYGLPDGTKFKKTKTGLVPIKEKSRTK